MSSIELLACMNDIDYELIQAANKPKKKQQLVWIQWASIAACLLLVSGLGVFSSRLTPNPMPVSYILEFSLNDTSYKTPSLQDCVDYGLITNASEVRSADVIMTITKENLGEEMGTIVVYDGYKNIHCKIYHHKAYADSDEICILAYPKGEYKLFINEDRL